MTEDKTYATRLNTNAAEFKLSHSLRIELFYEGKLRCVGHDELPFYLGRDHDSCDMAVTGETISRRHCALQIRDYQIGLLDTSTNGTFIKPGRADSVFIHNEFYPLVGKGAIKLGQRIDLDDPDLILFKVVSE